MTPLAQLIEAALFAADHPLTIEELAPLDPDASPSEVKAALDWLRDHYEYDGHGVELSELGGGFQIVTRPPLAEALERARMARRSPRLTTAMLEALAVIAYRQPVGRAEVEEIRGVNSSGVLRSLQERGLIEVVGRSEGMGRPLLYGTTPLFLELLGLPDLANLPGSDAFAIALQPPGPQAPPPEDAAAYVEAES